MADYVSWPTICLFCMQKKVQVLKINVSNSKLRLSIQFKYGSLSYYKQIPSYGPIQMKFQMCLSYKYDDKSKNVYVYE